MYLGRSRAFYIKGTEPAASEGDQPLSTMADRDKVMGPSPVGSGSLIYRHGHFGELSDAQRS